MLGNFCTGLKSILRKQIQKNFNSWYSVKSYQPQKVFVNTFTTDESDEVELLGLTIDSGLNFIKHIDKLCRNAECKLHALRRIRKYLSSWVDYMEIFFPGWKKMPLFVKFQPGLKYDSLENIKSLEG